MNTKYLKIVISITTFFSLINITYCQPPGLSFIRLSPDARNSSMGNAVTASCDGISGITSNPATVSSNPKLLSELNLSYYRGLMDTYSGGVGFLKTIRDYNSAFCIIWQTVASGITEVQRLTNDDFLNSVEQINAETDYLLSLTYGFRKRFSNTTILSLGVTLKYFNSTLADSYKIENYAADLGMIYSVPTLTPNIKLGFSCLNIGQKYKYFETEENLPLCLKIGIAATYILGHNNKILLAVDIVQYTDEPVRTNLGLEYYINDRFVIRTGYCNKQTTYEISGGIGIKLSNLWFDYSISNIITDFYSHRGTLSYINDITQQKETLDELYNKGVKYYEQGYLLEAIDCFNNILMISPTYKQTLQMLTIINDKLQNFQGRKIN